MVAQLSDTQLVLQSYNNSQTDFVSVSKKKEHLRMKANFRFEQKLTFVVQQEERVVCDHNVFDFSRKMLLIQKLGSEGDFVSGLAYT